MTITQTIEIPADYRIFLDLPKSLPVGVKARVDINISTKKPDRQPVSQIEHVRMLLRKEMSAQGTLYTKAESGEGWEAYIKENHAES